jgi:hypothetical protein
MSNHEELIPRIFQDLNQLRIDLSEFKVQVRRERTTKRRKERNGGPNVIGSSDRSVFIADHHC